jgi:hypothetical protein
MSTDDKMRDRAKPAWHNLAEQATQEGDGEKLCRLVEELCDSIDAAQAAKKRPSQSATPKEEQSEAQKMIQQDAKKS